MDLQVQFLEEVVGPVVVSQLPFLERASQETVSLSVRKVEQDHPRMIDSTGLNNHLRSIHRFR